MGCTRSALDRRAVIYVLVVAVLAWQGDGALSAAQDAYRHKSMADCQAGARQIVEAMAKINAGARVIAQCVAMQPPVGA